MRALDKAVTGPGHFGYCPPCAPLPTPGVALTRGTGEWQMPVTCRVTLLTLGGLALAVSASGARPDVWLEVRSPNFVVIANAGEAQARRVSAQFEHARAVLRHVLGDATVDARQPIVILAVKNERSLRELLPQFWERRGPRPVAVSWKGPHQHDVALRVDASPDQQPRLVGHEYLHVLTSVRVPDAPAWLDEGLSEFWTSVDVREGTVEVGRPLLNHLALLRSRPWIPLDELLAVARGHYAGDSRTLAMFYAQSWALVHFLTLGEGAGVDGRSAEVQLKADATEGRDAGSRAVRVEFAPSAYAGRLRQGVDPVEAARLAFGDLGALAQALAAYVHAGRFRVVQVEALPQDAVPAQTLRVRVLPPAESLAVRGSFLVAGERPSKALPLLSEALALNPTAPLTLETLGDFHFRQNNPDEARRWFERATATGAASHLAHFYLAILAPSGAEDHLRRAIALDPTFAPAYARLADLYARDNRNLEEALRLARRATGLEPDDPGYWVDLGRLLLRLQSPIEARTAGERASTVARSARERAWAASFLSELDLWRSR